MCQWVAACHEDNLCRYGMVVAMTMDARGCTKLQLTVLVCLSPPGPLQHWSCGGKSAIMLLCVTLEAVVCLLKGCHQDLCRPLEMRGGPPCLWRCNGRGPSHLLPETVETSIAAFGLGCWT